MKVWKIFKTITNYTSTIGMVLSGACIGVTIALVTLEVILRSFFRMSTMASDELSGYFLVGTLFFGVAYCTKTEGHVKIDFLYSHLKGIWKLLSDSIVYSLAIGFTIVLLVNGYKLVLENYKLHILSTTVLQIPLFIPQLVLIIGPVTLLMQLLENFIETLTPFFWRRRDGENT